MAPTNNPDQRPTADPPRAISAGAVISPRMASERATRGQPARPVIAIPDSLDHADGFSTPDSPTTTGVTALLCRYRASRLHRPWSDQQVRPGLRMFIFDWAATWSQTPMTDDSSLRPAHPTIRGTTHP